ncbi:MAG: peroxiredoxin, partial [Myxococcota bacterium]
MRFALVRPARLFLSLTLIAVGPTACGDAASPSAATPKTGEADAKTPNPAEPAKEAPMEQKVLAEGDAAPKVEMTLQDGTKVALGDQKGLVFVYFYPKDDTPGCTVEAKGLRDNYADLQERGVKVFGVSMQDAASHQAFIEKHELPFGLVVDDGS